MSYFEGPHNLLRAQIFFFVIETYYIVTDASISADSADPLSVNFEGPRAILRPSAREPALFLPLNRSRAVAKIPFLKQIRI